MITDPASTITQSHWGLPSGLGHFIPLFFSFLIRSSAIEFACLLERQVAIIKKSAIEVLFLRLIISICSALASSKISLTILISLILLLIIFSS
tara:strand:- start:33 stop:311 length:279 start_codon:yes stop_codon:yes gene_type:complete